MVKLSPNVTDIAAVARAVEEAGVDSVSAVNTYVGMKVHRGIRAPVLPGRGTGGLSGPVIKPLALAAVAQVRAAVRIPVVGVGGIMDAGDALEFLIAGADAVQVGTATFVNPGAALEILDGLLALALRFGTGRLPGRPRQGRHGGAPCRDRTRINRLKAGCSAVELRGRLGPHYARRPARRPGPSRCLTILPCPPPSPASRPGSRSAATDAAPCGTGWPRGRSALCLRLLFLGRLHLEGADGVPLEGPLLVASNHISNWDPLILGAFFPGTLFAMAKRELFRPSPVAWLLAGCNCFPVDRGNADRRALRISLDLLRARRRLLLFIEGHRSRGRGMGPAEAGAGFLVRRTQAPVLPVAIWGTERALRPAGGLLPRRGRIRVRYGRPLTVSGRSDQEIADAIAAEVAALLPSGYRGPSASSVTPGTPRRRASRRSPGR